MSSMSSSHSIPNPNPNSNKPSSSSTQSTKPNRKNRNKKKRNKKNRNKKIPNWLDLSEDIWSLIFSKLYTIHLIENVQKVCMLFRQICKQASLYKVVDMTLSDAFMSLPHDANIMTRHIVDLSCGGLLDIYLEFVCDDDTLMYIAERSKKLKHLRLGHYTYVYDDALIDVVKMLPELEELEIIICSFSDETYEAIGHACPSLKSFSLNDVGSRRRKSSYNENALAIAKSMPNLRKLQVIGNWFNNEGLKAILDGCPHLEALDLRACFNVDLSGDLGKRCGEIKHLRLPNDSTADYHHQACTDSEQDLARKFNSPPTSDYDYYDSDDTDFGFYPDFSDYLDIDDFEDDCLFPDIFFFGAHHLDYDSSE